MWYQQIWRAHNKSPTYFFIPPPFFYGTQKLPSKHWPTQDLLSFSKVAAPYAFRADSGLPLSQSWGSGVSLGNNHPPRHKFCTHKGWTQDPTRSSALPSDFHKVSPAVLTLAKVESQLQTGAEVGMAAGTLQHVTLYVGPSILGTDQGRQLVGFACPLERVLALRSPQGNKFISIPPHPRLPGGSAPIFGNVAWLPLLDIGLHRFNPSLALWLAVLTEEVIPNLWLFCQRLVLLYSNH